MITSSDLNVASATQLARAIKAREVSSAAVVEACLERIEEANPRLNAVVALRADEARAEAQAADKAVAGGQALGALHGVPVTIKDAFDLVGLPATSGTLGRKNFVPNVDATAVARLKAAGAIPLGKTNVPELTLAYETDNLIHGRTNNPYDVARTPGGSSGGEAAIIAAGGSPLGIGTDVGGSIRVPAHFCGIAGLKPTLGRVPTTGVFPPAVGVPGSLYHVGPLARSVGDLALALTVLAGPDGFDPRVAPAPLGAPELVDLKSLRVAYFADNGLASPTTETVAAIRDAATKLRDGGATIEEARPDGIDKAFELFAALFGADDSASVLHLIEMVGTTAMHPLLSRLGEAVHPFAMPTAAFAGLLAQVDIFRMTMLGFLSRYDVLVCPVVAQPAMLHGTSLNADVLPGFSYAMTHSLTGWPIVVVRAGTSSEGLPIGVQIAARPWREDVALAAALCVER